MVTESNLAESLMWNNGGMSFGPCSVGAFMAIACAPKRVLKSAVAVSGPIEKYDQGDIVTLSEIAEKATAKHRRLVGEVLFGDNIYCVDKRSDGWYVKRVNWDRGICFDSKEAMVNWFKGQLE